MRTLLLLMLLLLAGCASTPPPAVVPIETPAETLIAHPVEDSLLSPVSQCLPAGGCAGVFGSDTSVFKEHTWVALDVTVTPEEDFPPDQVLGQASRIRVVAYCLGERLTCPQQPIASAEGDFPLRLQADGFRIADPDSLAFRVEYLGPLPVEGSGASYRLAGTLVSSDPSDPDVH